MVSQPTLDVSPELWDTVTDDADAIADEYRDAGWETLTLFPGSVVPLPSSGSGSPAQFGEEGPESTTDRFGLDVLIPDNQFDELEAHVADGSFDSFEAHRGEADGTVLLVLVVTDEASRRAVVCPLYYDLSAAETMRSRAETEGKMHTYVHTLDQSRQLEFAHANPDLFFPEQP